MPPVIGTREEVIARIKVVAGHVDDSDPARLQLAGSDHLIEVSLREEQPTAMTFFVRGGDGCIPLLMRVTTELGLVAFDTSSGEFMTAATGAASLSAWENYRDRCMGDMNS